MEDFRRKSSYVASGHTVDTLAILTYASVVSSETARIAMTLAALNDLEVKASDNENTYLTERYGSRLERSSQRYESTLKKKSNSICSHAVRESVAMDESIKGRVSTHCNPADLATKCCLAGKSVTV
jgi:hypothetical protein